MFMFSCKLHCMPGYFSYKYCECVRSNKEQNHTRIQHFIEQVAFD